jgi:hypothetical protein
VKSEGEREYVDVNELIDRVSPSSATNKARGGPEAPAEGSAPVLSETVRLVQVFSNIILNAYQAMQGGGTLSITTAREGARIRVTFADTGSGIPPELLDQIFVPFLPPRSRPLAPAWASTSRVRSSPTSVVISAPHPRHKVRSSSSFCLLRPDALAHRSCQQGARMRG